LNTAKIFLESVGKNLTIYPSSQLREIGLGYFEGLDGPSTWRLADAKAVEMGIIPEGEEAPEATRIDMLHLMDPYRLAEKYEDFLNRLKNGIMGILNNHPDKKHILIISHSAAIKAVFDTFDPDFKTVFEAQNGSISTINYYNNRFKVQSFSRFEGP
jgi:probable phosphoglycerate mutase